jgi:hypothetical protein
VKAQADQLKLLNSPTILIDQATGTGRAQLILKNDSPKPKVYLTADITGPRASNARFSFTTRKCFLILEHIGRDHGFC